MVSDPRQDQALEALFEASLEATPDPSPDFMERLLQDADNAMPTVAVPAQAPTPSVFVRLKGLFAASGLTGAAALGVWIGFVMPETLNTFADGFATEETVSLSAFLPGADLFALSE